MGDTKIRSGTAVMRGVLIRERSRMKLKCHIFFDRRQILSLLMAVMTGWMTAEFVKSHDLWWIFWGFIALACSALALGLPCLYIMTPKGLHLIHAVGLIRRYVSWGSVKGLSVKYDTGSKRLPYVFDTFWIYGDVQGPTFFFTENEMVRTLRARILLERYTGLKVEGILLNEIKESRKRRKEKKEQARRSAERQARVERNREAKKSAKNSASRPTKK